MKIQTQIALTLFFASASLAEEPNFFIPTLSLEQEVNISDNIGVINPLNIIRLKPTDNIKFYLSDGTELIGLVKETQEFNKEMFKVFGEIQNKPNTGFGFVLAKEGTLAKESVFAGAVVFRDTDETYTMQYIEAAKGFMLVKTKFKKPQLKVSNKNSKNYLTLSKSIL